jgi:hypothetical protein
LVNDPHVKLTADDDVPVKRESPPTGGNCRLTRRRVKFDDNIMVVVVWVSRRGQYPDDAIRKRRDRGVPSALDRPL